MNNSSRPRFSILVPTRGRPELAGLAIRSALAQTYPDFEVVVSDNNRDNAHDARMKEVVAALDDSRIVHVRPDRVLGMPDNWQNALRHSRGERVIVLEDDCVLSSRCLEI